MSRFVIAALVSFLSLGTTIGYAQPSPQNSINIAQEAERRIEEQRLARERTAQSQIQNTNANNRLDDAAQNPNTLIQRSPSTPVLSYRKEPFRVMFEESPCFNINQILWTGAALFEDITNAALPMMGRCVGAKTLESLQVYLSEALISQGYVTTRILIPEQNLATGELKIQLLAGTISDRQTTANDIGAIGMALPSRNGQRLNQRDIDQAIENVRRLPSQGSFAIDISPGAEAGDSVLVMKSPVDPKRWRIGLSLDNTGAKSTGNEYPFGANITIDSPLGLYDSLSANFGSNSNPGVNDRYSRSKGLNWSLPVGYALWSVGVNDSTYKQTVAGYAAPIVYSGRSTGIDLGVGYVYHRNATVKNTANFKLSRKTSRSYIEDVLVDIQSKDIVSFDASLNHRHNIDAAVWDTTVGLRGTIPSRSKTLGFIQGQPDWDGRTRVAYINSQLTVPYQFGGDSGKDHKGKFQSSLRWQAARTLVPNSDFFSLGGRYSIRGTDGQVSLASQKGLLIRNDASLRLPTTEIDVYIAYDLGMVSGLNTQNLLGKYLSGAGIGIRGAALGLQLDLFAGTTTRKPAGFKSESPAIYGQVSLDF